MTGWANPYALHRTQASHGGCTSPLLVDRVAELESLVVL